MKIREVGSVRKLLKDSIYIGYGTTAYCFLNRDNNIIKIYNNSGYTKHLFEHVDMYQRLIDINSIQNDTYIGPDELLMKDGHVIGYIYPYVEANTLKNASGKTTLFDFFNNFNILLEDTRDISDKNFRLYDVHFKNILFDGYYYVIDLDKGKIVTDSNRLFNCNMESIRETLVGQIFNIKPWEIVFFKDEDIEDVYKNMSWISEEDVYNFFELLARKSDIPNPSIKQLRRKIEYKKVFNEYKKL